MAVSELASEQANRMQSQSQCILKENPVTPPINRPAGVLAGRPASQPPEPNSIYTFQAEYAEAEVKEEEEVVVAESNQIQNQVPGT